jgi:hypothetical protein
MKNRSTLLMIGFIALLVWSTDLSKASGIPQLNQEQLAHESDIIFVGKVVQIDSIEVTNKRYGDAIALPPTWMKYKIIFDVIETFKGGPIDSVITYFANNTPTIWFDHYKFLKLWDIGNTLLLHVFTIHKTGASVLYQHPYEVRDDTIIEFKMTIEQYRVWYKNEITNRKYQSIYLHKP